MLFKLIATFALVLTLSGCAAWTPVKYAADKVCDASPARQALLAEEFDKATFPHQLRVHCNAQED